MLGFDTHTHIGTSIASFYFARQKAQCKRSICEKPANVLLTNGIIEAGNDGLNTTIMFAQCIDVVRDQTQSSATAKGARNLEIICCIATLDDFQGLQSKKEQTCY